MPSDPRFVLTITACPARSKPMSECIGEALTAAGYEFRLVPLPSGPLTDKLTDVVQEAEQAWEERRERDAQVEFPLSSGPSFGAGFRAGFRAAREFDAPPNERERVQQVVDQAHEENWGGRHISGFCAACADAYKVAVVVAAPSPNVEPQQESREAELREELRIRNADALRAREQCHKLRDLAIESRKGHEAAEARVIALEALREAGNRRCKRLEAALAWYANPNNMTEFGPDDLGKRARAALDAAEREKCGVDSGAG